MNKNLGLGSVVATLLVMLAWEQDVQAQAVDMDIESLRLDFAVREESFKNASFRMTVTDRTREGLGLVKGGKFIKKVQVADVTLDLSQKGDMIPRARVEVSETPNPDVIPRLPKGTTRVRYWESTTPRDFRSLEFHHTGRKIGMISDDLGVRWLVNPLELISMGRWSMNRYLFNKNISMEFNKDVQIDGRMTVRIKWGTDIGNTGVENHPRGVYRGTVWVAPDLGFATVQSVTERKPTSDAPWKEIIRVECGGFVSVEGHWLPTNARFVEHSYYSDDLYYQLTKESSVSFENWRINRELTDEDYEIKFPKGAIVRDLTRGDVTYTRGSYGDPKYVRHHVQEARDLARQWNITVMDVVFWGSLNLAVVCLCLWIFRFVKRMRSELKS